MNQVWLFENLKTTIIKSNNHPNNQQELRASFNTHPTLESVIDYHHQNLNKIFVNNIVHCDDG
jgi:hypothetical protein